jgi:acyl-CoA reductase-like NAD-dependent aldehyde dehydrogenase
LKIINPATEEILQEPHEDTEATIRAKVDAARRAQPAWQRVPLTQRLEAIRRFGDALQAEKERLAGILTSEMGKPITQSRNELSAMAERIGFFLTATPQAVADEVVQPRRADGATTQMEERIRYEPLGVVANISAWNYPYFVGSNVFLPALLTGNAVLYKPSEFATLTGLAIAALLHQSGVPVDVFAPIVGAGPVGAALLAQPIDGVFFTGSYTTGRKVAEAAAPRLLHVQLELGGKDPVYVCDDVAVDAAAAAVAEGVFYNAGQSCCAIERVYVHERIADAFTNALATVARKLTVGDPRSEQTYIGPLARAAQLDVLAAQVEEALHLGGRLLCGGQRRAGRGFYFEPTVIADADHRMRLMREESFGPVIGVATVANDEAALALMNDTEYGLTAGVYSSDRARAERILSQVDAGTVYWNCCDRVSPRLPWTGRKKSGTGSTLSIAGIRSFVQPKAWHLAPPP